MSSRARTPGSPDESGVSIIEAAIAMALMALVAGWVASTIGSTGRVLGETRAQEQATQLALESIEWTRSLSWDELRMAPAATSIDPNVDHGARTLLGTRFGLDVDEPLVEGGEAALVPPTVQETLGNDTFTINTYVTEIDAGLRRVTVEVRWQIADSPRRHVAGTLISEVSAP